MYHLFLDLEYEVGRFLDEEYEVGRFVLGCPLGLCSFLDII
jgi:hypothetical protein